MFLPSKKSHTTFPVLGHIVIMPMETSEPLAAFCSIKHIKGGGLYVSKSSTESNSSTYLKKFDQQWIVSLKSGYLRCRCIEMSELTLEYSISIVTRFLQSSGLDLVNNSYSITLCKQSKAMSVVKTKTGCNSLLEMNGTSMSGN